MLMKSVWRGVLVGAIVFVLDGRAALAQEKQVTAPVQQTLKERDGQHDFDFEIGNWKTHLRRRLRPLTGSDEWVELEGISVVRPILGGKANLVELTIYLPKGGRFEGMSLRLYDPKAKQWSLNFVNASDGALSPPTVGEFRNGRGEFYGQEEHDGRAILVRFVISDMKPDSCRFEQSFSADGGKTWEVNWIAVDTRMPEAVAGASVPGASGSTSP
jgi:hypothetical protein